MSLPHRTRRRQDGLGFVALLIAVWTLSMSCSVEEARTPNDVLGEDGAVAPRGSLSQRMLSSPAWTATSPMVVMPRTMAKAVKLSSGKVLVMGGRWSSQADAVQAEVYDPITNSWSPAGSMATPREGHAAVLLADGRVLVAGGLSSTGATLASAELYNPSNNSWTSAGSMLWPRLNFTATLLTNGQVLIAGYGITAELYNPANNSWIQTGNMNANRQHQTATLLPNGRVLMTGGYNTPPYSSTELYNPATQSWTVAAPMASPRYAHTATLLPNGKVLVTGGFNDVASAELYDPTLNSWSPAGAMSTTRGFHIAALVNGKVLVSGGHTTSAMYSRQTADLYDPASNSWTATASMLSPRSFHVGAALSNGKVLVAGGGGYPSAEVYSPTDIDLGSAVGPRVAKLSPCGASNVFTPSCAPNSTAPEVSFTWTAPYAGTFSFTTSGSNYDTVLQMIDAATGTMMGCNDDGAVGTPQSMLTVPLAAGQRIVLVVDGALTSCGMLELNISPPPCTWTQWYDRDNPSGVGDYEGRADQIPAVCAAPQSVECTTLSGVNWTQTGETVTCTPSEGFACANADQSDGACQDYKVRFCCP